MTKINYKKEIIKIDNYKKYVMSYRQRGFTEHESILLGIRDMKKDNEKSYYEITQSGTVNTGKF